MNRAPAGRPTAPRYALVTRRDGDEAAQIYLLSNTGGEARRLTSHPTSVRSLTWSPDGRVIYFLTSDPKTDEQKAREKVKDDVYTFDENYEQQHLWKVTVATGAAERVTSGDYSVLFYGLSRDGSRIAFERAPNPGYMGTPTAARCGS